MTPSSSKVAALVPNTGMSCHAAPKASRLRTSWRPTSRRASSAPRRSNLLIATASAKSSMSIFSSWDAAPNSGVITYSARSTNGTMSASPCPIPGVSTTTRSKAAAWRTAITSARRSGSCPPAPRVAIDRKKTRPPSSAFIRIRSPSSAPPPRRRVGSTASTAIRSLSSWSRRNRRSSSSVSDDLPDPPVPVMPSTGTRRRGPARWTSGRRPFSASVSARATVVGSPVWSPSNDAGATARSTSHSRIIRSIIPGSPSRWPSSGEKIRETPRECSSAISRGTITPPPPP